MILTILQNVLWIVNVITVYQLERILFDPQGAFTELDKGYFAD